MKKFKKPLQNTKRYDIITRYGTREVLTGCEFEVRWKI